MQIARMSLRGVENRKRISQHAAAVHCCNYIKVSEPTQTRASKQYTSENGQA
jgi:hypothetical protein